MYYQWCNMQMPDNMKLGRIWKNEEQKRQANRINKIGTPPKYRQETITIEILRNGRLLPSQWVDQSTGDSATFCKIVQNNSNLGPEITHSITVEADFSWKSVERRSPHSPVLFFATLLVDMLSGPRVAGQAHIFAL